MKRADLLDRFPVIVGNYRLSVVERRGVEQMAARIVTHGGMPSGRPGELRAYPPHDLIRGLEVVAILLRKLCDLGLELARTLSQRNPALQLVLYHANALRK